MENTVGQNNIDGSAETFDDLDFKNRTLQLGEVHQLVAHALLSEIDEEHDHVRGTFSGNGGGWDEGNIASEVLVVIVRHGVETLFGESELSFLQPILKFPLHSALLLGEGTAEVVVGCRLPAIQTIDLWLDKHICFTAQAANTNLVQSDDERCLAVSEKAEGFQSLWFETVLFAKEICPVFGEELWRELTMISTTRIAMLHNELPRLRKLVKDSCPGVSMMRRPGILYSCFPSYRHGSILRR